MKAAWLVVFLVGCGPTYIDAVGLEPTTLSSGLVAHWTFDQTDGPVLVDDSLNGRNGKITGATFRNDGRFGSALHFRFGDSVTVENFPNALSSWSFSAWLRISDEDMPNDPNEDFGTVISTELMQQGGWQFQTRDRSSRIYWTFAYWIGPGLNYAHHECVCLEQLGRWSHATVVRDATALSFYVDGQLAAPPSPSPAPILAGSSTLYMGRWMGAGRPFAGSIDDVTIYNRALSPAEVAELDQRSPPPPK